MRARWRRPSAPWPSDWRTTASTGAAPLPAVLANHVGSAYHAELLREALPADMRWFGALMRDAGAALPERHLGLLQAAEIADLDARLDRLADASAKRTGAASCRRRWTFADAAAPELPPLLAGKHHCDGARCRLGFIYPANLDTLRALGAELAFFSPLAGDAVWLPGGPAGRPTVRRRVAAGRLPRAARRALAANSGSRCGPARRPGCAPMWPRASRCWPNAAAS
jgi:hypothetical protein